MTLIRELINIPEQVQDGDFVLKLTQGIKVDPVGTVDSYVVTDQLATAFDEALGLVTSAVADGQSKATYLHGSFGSGKSHFMAMLHLLLSHDTHARAKPELHDAVSKWGPKLDDKKFLLVPVHFLDAKSMEQKILGGYVECVEELGLKGPLPSVFLGDEIMATELPNLRRRMGDDDLLGGLNSGAAEADDWGEFTSTWTTETLNAALEASAMDPRRQDLVAAYIATFREGTVLETASTGRGFIDLDRGLAAISTHAAANGYDGVVLFLDELILWLASNIGNLDFVQAESQKLTKLVEATAAGRPVPIISFIARQRDLRELVGDHIAGNEQRSFADSLELQQGRFGRITLASGNLPVVAHQRLLEPVDGAAAELLRSAVDGAIGDRDDIKRQLLGSDTDLELFRTVYPFSPALVEVLVDVSEALQRERTALKVMLQLLVDQRDTLELGQIIPVGDLWDVVSGREEPFSSELKSLFEIARKLWQTKLEPALRVINNVTSNTPEGAVERRALINDARIVKTVLLAALVPEVEAFRGLDAGRLVALNWGSITSPISGTEAQILAGKLRRLGGLVGELMVGDDQSNPTISIRLANVDTDDIVARASETYDNQGARRQIVRALMVTALDNRIEDDLTGTLEYQWRGSNRPVDVAFGNVRDHKQMPDNALVASPDRPKLVIDFPFDDTGRTPEEDLARLDDWAQQHDPTTTVCWLPSFFNAQGLATLGRYVAVDELLKPDRFEQYTRHLSINDRFQAKPIIESLHNQLATQLSEAILCAYGVVSRTNPLIDPANSLTEHYRCLDRSVPIKPTTRPTLGEALDELCDQIFCGLYPGHPEFEAHISSTQLKTTWSEIQRALADPNGRINVEKAHRKTLRNVANALQLGTMHESHFTLDDYWRKQLDRHLNQKDDGSATVDQMRSWIDDVPGGPRGLEPSVADLVVLTVAAQTDHRLVMHGEGFVGELGKTFPGDIQLVPEQLPQPEQWASAIERAAQIFGLTFHKKVTGPELTSMSVKLNTKVNELVGPATGLVDVLSKAYTTWGLGEGDRLSTARSARDLVSGLKSADGNEMVAMLADFESSTSDKATAKSLTTAGPVAESVGRANLILWASAKSVVEMDATQVLTNDELVIAFESAATQIEAAATRQMQTLSASSDADLAQRSAQGADSVPVSKVSPAQAGMHETVLISADDVETLAGQLREAIAESGPIEVRWSKRELP